MAGTVQRLIRHIWGFIGTPASIQNKQQSFNEGDNGSGRDRTQLVAKGPSGIPHVWVTYEEIVDYVATEISSISASFGDTPFVKVSTWAELKTLVDTSLVSLNIFCDDGSALGITETITTTPYTYAIVPLVSHNIYGSGGECLSFEVDKAILTGATAGTFTVTYPIDDAEISIKFFDRLRADLINKTTVDSNTFTIINDVGTLPDDTENKSLMISEISSNFINVYFDVPDPDLGDTNLSIYEVNNSALELDATISLFSGKHTQNKLSVIQTATPTSSHRIAESIGSIPALVTDVRVSTGRSSTSLPVSRYDNHVADVVSSSIVFFDGTTIFTFFNGETGSTSFYCDENSHSGTGGTNLPWGTDYAVHQLRAVALFSLSGNGGRATNCYNDGLGWRYSLDDEIATVEYTKNEDNMDQKLILVSDDASIVADASITWYVKYRNWLTYPQVEAFDNTTIPTDIYLAVDSYKCLPNDAFEIKDLTGNTYTCYGIYMKDNTGSYIWRVIDPLFRIDLVNSDGEKSVYHGGPSISVGSEFTQAVMDSTYKKLGTLLYSDVATAKTLSYGYYRAVISGRVTVSASGGIQGVTVSLDGTITILGAPDNLVFVMENLNGGVLGDSVTFCKVMYIRVGSLGASVSIGTILSNTTLDSVNCIYEPIEHQESIAL